MRSFGSLPSPLVLGILVAIGVFAVDQASKWLILAYFAEHRQFVDVTSFFNVVLVWNYGVSFGMFSSDSIWNTIFLIALALGIVAFLVRWLLRTQRKALAVALGLVIGGAFGNVLDRVVHGAVVDFLDFYIGQWHWPAFNIADSGITVGAVILILDALFRGEERPKISSSNKANRAG